MSRPISAGDDLIDAARGEKVAALGPLGRNTGQPRSGAGMVLEQLLRPREIADDGEDVAKRFERLKNRRQLEAGRRRCGRPLIQDHAVRDVDEPGALRRLRGGLRRRRQRRHHRVEQRQRQRSCPRPRRNVRRGSERFVMNMITSSRWPRPELGRRAHLKRRTRDHAQHERRPPIVAFAQPAGRSLERPACRRTRRCGRARR